MDARLKEIVDNFDAMKIGTDEPFRFRCTMCGKCCINREDILLTPRDIYNMSKELGITTKELFETYCEAYIGGDSRMPIVRLKPRGSIKRCPLLKDRKCSVHRAKPTVCAMFPIGRCLMSEKDGDSFQKMSAGQTQYIFTDPGCGDHTETHTVREWLGEFGIPLEDAFFAKWQNTVVKLGQFFCEAEKTTSGHIMELMWMAALAGIYLNYETGKDFMPQFEENTKEICALLELAPVKEGEVKANG